MTPQGINDFINDLIDEEIENIREENDETEDMEEEDCLAPEEVYRMAKYKVRSIITEELAKLY